MGCVHIALGENGEPALFKVCVDCGRRGVCTRGEDSEFVYVRPNSSRDYDTWTARCRECHHALNRERVREWRRRKYEQDPNYFRDYIRMRRAEQRPSARGKLPKRKRMVRVPLAPFRAWLLAYMERCGISSAEDAGMDLGIDTRAARRYVEGSQPWAKIEAVDLALLNARVEIELDGRPIFDVDDLYPEMFSDSAEAA